MSSVAGTPFQLTTVCPVDLFACSGLPQKSSAGGVSSVCNTRPKPQVRPLPRPNCNNSMHSLSNMIQNSVPIHRDAVQSPEAHPVSRLQSYHNNSVATSWDGNNVVERTSKLQLPDHGRFQERPKFKTLLLPVRSSVQGTHWYTPSPVAIISNDAQDHNQSVCLLMSTDPMHAVALLLQGSGPHFCPGGNVNAAVRRGDTSFSLLPFVGFVAQIRVRELEMLAFCSLHGFV